MSKKYIIKNLKNNKYLFEEYYFDIVDWDNYIDSDLSMYDTIDKAEEIVIKLLDQSSDMQERGAEFEKNNKYQIETIYFNKD